MNTTQSPPSSPHVRHDKGVVIMWELHMRGNIFIVERFRGSMHCSSCFRNQCEHARVAEQLEQSYQLSNQGEKPGSCFFCGRLAVERNGLSICARCAS
jgi:hypothetical protein